MSAAPKDVMNEQVLRLRRELAVANANLATALTMMRRVPCQRLTHQDPAKPCEWCLFLAVNPVHNFADCIKADGDKPCRDCAEYAIEAVGAPAVARCLDPCGTCENCIANDASPSCAAVGCSRAPVEHGWCAKHAAYWREPTGPVLDPYCHLAASEIPNFGTNRDKHHCPQLHRDKPLKQSAVAPDSQLGGAPKWSLPDADAWKWICHRCGYYVESVVAAEMQTLRTEHLKKQHQAAPKESDEGPG